MPDRYDTPIPAGRRAAYEAWLKAESRKQKRDVSLDQEDYDLQGFWLAGEGTDERGHGTDRFKKPNHPTFSTESQYSAPGMEGGRWETRDGRTVFVPSATNLASYPWDELQRYFKERERGVTLAQPDQVPVRPPAASVPPLPPPPLPSGLRGSVPAASSSAPPPPPGSQQMLMRRITETRRGPDQGPFRTRRNMRKGEIAELWRQAQGDQHMDLSGLMRALGETLGEKGIGEGTPRGVTAVTPGSVPPQNYYGGRTPHWDQLQQYLKTPEGAKTEQYTTPVGGFKEYVTPPGSNFIPRRYDAYASQQPGNAPFAVYRADKDEPEVRGHERIHMGQYMTPPVSNEQYLERFPEARNSLSYNPKNPFWSWEPPAHGYSLPVEQRSRYQQDVAQAHLDGDLAPNPTPPMLRQMQGLTDYLDFRNALGGQQAEGIEAQLPPELLEAYVREGPELTARKKKLPPLPVPKALLK